MLTDLLADLVSASAAFLAGSAAVALARAVTTARHANGRFDER